jgi:hypothetical protein
VIYRTDEEYSILRGGEGCAQIGTIAGDLFHDRESLTLKLQTIGSESLRHQDIPSGEEQVSRSIRRRRRRIFGVRDIL